MIGYVAQGRRIEKAFEIQGRQKMDVNEEEKMEVRGGIGRKSKGVERKGGRDLSSLPSHHSWKHGFVFKVMNYMVDIRNGKRQIEIGMEEGRTPLSLPPQVHLPKPCLFLLFEFLFQLSESSFHCKSPC